MRHDLEIKLHEDFPKLFTDPERNSFLYFECGDGWYDLIRELAEKIYPLLTIHPEYECPMRADQVKEKYGTLRFYMNCETDEISEIIKEYEKKSAFVCEECGKPGRLNKGPWYNTYCEEHHK